MAQSVQKYLDNYDGDAEKALAAAVSDVAKRENQNTSARAFKRAYSGLVESLKLPTDVDAESEAEAQTLAQRALTTIQAKPDREADTEALETLRDLLDAYAEHTGIDLVAALEALPENATDEQVDALIAGAFKPMADLQGKARMADVTLAAQALGKPADALAEILDGKSIELRQVKGEDGKEADVWGIPGDGNTFKHLSDLKAVQYLTASAPAAAPSPSGQRLPAQEAKGAQTTAKTVEERTQELRSQISI